jgi:hypothetical protein
LPELTIRRVRVAGTGDFCRAYWVDGGWIVRVARHPQASAALRREAAVLPVLARALQMASRCPNTWAPIREPATPSSLTVP